MTTERFEAPVEQTQLVEVGITEPVRRTNSGGVDYDYYLARGRRLRAEAFNQTAKRVWRVIQRFVGHLRTRTRLKASINKRPAGVGGQ